MDEASHSRVSATYPIRRSQPERIPNHAGKSRPIFPPNAQSPQDHLHEVGAGTTAPGCRTDRGSQYDTFVARKRFPRHCGGIGRAMSETLQNEPIERRLKKCLVHGPECEARIGAITRLRTIFWSQ